MNKNWLKCVICDKDLVWNQRKYCCNNCKAKWHYRSSNRNTYYYQTKRAKERKLMFIEQLWWCCQKCWYKKNSAALEFHHTRDKEFKLCSRKIANTKMETLREELAKCELLCSNCHREHHNPECFMGE